MDLSISISHKGISHLNPIWMKKTKHSPTKAILVHDYVQKNKNYKKLRTLAICNTMKCTYQILAKLILQPYE